jgi:hypothetical protein
MTTGTQGSYRAPPAPRGHPPGFYRAECAILPRLMAAAFVDVEVSEAKHLLSSSLGERN